MLQPVQQVLQTLHAAGCASGGMWADKAGWILFLSGSAGAVLRAACGSHPTLSKRTLLDILMGGSAPIFLNLFKLVPLEGVSFFQLAIYGGAVGLFGSYFLQWGMYKLGVFKSDIRADAPGDAGNLLNGGAPKP